MFQIELREYRILRIAAHAFWAFYEDGVLVGELHGLATNRKTGASRAVCTRRDQLRAWSFSGPRPMDSAPQALGRGGLSGLYIPGQASRIVFESDGPEAQLKWMRAVLAGDTLNDANIEYRALGGSRHDLTTGNSNSAWRTFADVMNVPAPRLDAWVRPGEQKNLLPAETYAGLYEAPFDQASVRPSSAIAHGTHERVPAGSAAKGLSVRHAPQAQRATVVSIEPRTPKRKPA
ncbi:MAG TPA: hypothetical protein VL424_13880 [Pararobbsia sp.]|nr:hypothetical protein [Pararobbsia sp.]